MDGSWFAHMNGLNSVPYEPPVPTATPMVTEPLSSTSLPVSADTSSDASAAADMPTSADTPMRMDTPFSTTTSPSTDTASSTPPSTKSKKRKLDVMQNGSTPSTPSPSSAPAQNTPYTPNNSSTQMEDYCFSPRDYSLRDQLGSNELILIYVHDSAPGMVTIMSENVSDRFRKEQDIPFRQSLELKDYELVKDGVDAPPKSRVVAVVALSMRAFAIANAILPKSRGQGGQKKAQVGTTLPEKVKNRFQWDATTVIYVCMEVTPTVPLNIQLYTLLEPSGPGKLSTAIRIPKEIVFYRYRYRYGIPKRNVIAVIETLWISNAQKDTVRKEYTHAASGLNVRANATGNHLAFAPCEFGTLSQLITLIKGDIEKVRNPDAGDGNPLTFPDGIDDAIKRLEGVRIDDQAKDFSPWDNFASPHNVEVFGIEEATKLVGIINSTFPGARGRYFTPEFLIKLQIGISNSPLTLPTGKIAMFFREVQTKIDRKVHRKPEWQINLSNQAKVDTLVDEALASIRGRLGTDTGMVDFKGFPQAEYTSDAMLRAAYQNQIRILQDFVLKYDARAKDVFGGNNPALLATNTKVLMQALADSQDISERGNIGYMLCAWSVAWAIDLLQKSVIVPFRNSTDLKVH